MNIGFDLDKIFIDYPPFVPDSLVNRLYRRETSNKLEYRMPGKAERTLRVFSHHPLFRPVIKQNISELKKIKKNNCKIYLISSRFGFLKKRTESLINKNGFSTIFDGLYFNYDNEQPHLFKNRIIKKLKINTYIHDDINTITYLAAQNKNIKFYWLNSQKLGKLDVNINGITSISQISLK